MEKYELAKRKMHIMFADLKKGFDRVPIEVIWKALRKRVVDREIKAIKEMCINIKTSVKAQCMRLESFDVKVGVHQGLVEVLFCLRR